MRRLYGNRFFSVHPIGGPSRPPAPSALIVVERLAGDSVAFAVGQDDAQDAGGGDRQDDEGEQVELPGVQFLRPQRNQQPQDRHPKQPVQGLAEEYALDRKSTRLNSSH